MRLHLLCLPLQRVQGQGWRSGVSDTVSVDDQEPLLGDATEIGYVPQMPTYQDELDHIEQLQDVD